MMYKNKFSGVSKNKTDYMPHALAVIIFLLLFFKDKVSAFFCACSASSDYTTQNPGPIIHPDYDLKGVSENVEISVEDFERAQDTDVVAMQPSQLSQMFFPSTDTLMLTKIN